MTTAMLAIMLVLFALSVPVAVAIGLAAVAGIEFYTRFPLIVAAQQVYVALDPDGRPTAVPPLIFETDEQRQRAAEAEARQAARKQRKMSETK